MVKVILNELEMESVRLNRPLFGVADHLVPPGIPRCPQTSALKQQLLTQDSGHEHTVTWLERIIEPVRDQSSLHSNCVDDLENVTFSSHSGRSYSLSWARTSNGNRSPRHTVRAQLWTRQITIGSRQYEGYPVHGSPNRRQVSAQSGLTEEGEVVKKVKKGKRMEHEERE